MPDTPAWLPPMASCDGEWSQVLPMLWGIFERDFETGHPRFQGLPVWWDKRVLPGGSYPEGFWHLITRDCSRTDDRLPDFRRAERLPWCKPTITNESQPEALVFDCPHKNTLRTYVWLRDADYFVVLEKRKHRRGEIAFLITAFHVDGERTRRFIEQKHRSAV
jgi:hypothetical protein